MMMIIPLTYLVLSILQIPIAPEYFSGLKVTSNQEFLRANNKDVFKAARLLYL